MHACRMTSSTNIGLRLCSFVPSGHKRSKATTAPQNHFPYPLSHPLHINHQCLATQLDCWPPLHHQNVIVSGAAGHSMQADQNDLYARTWVALPCLNDHPP